MTASTALWHQLQPYLIAFYTHARLWVIPTAAMLACGVVIALGMPAKWRASQAMLVRDEAIGNRNGQGQFGSIDFMKVYQEKILEVARSRVVAEPVLVRIGPPAGKSRENWPTDNDITSLQSAIAVSAPKGTEFGRGNFFHLSVTGESPERALALTRTVCDELERNLGDLRKANANSVMIELERAQALAQADLDAATLKLESLEREVGEDLGELRVLSESGAGDSNLRTTLNQVKQELRHAESDRESLRQLKELLENAETGAAELLATPSRLLNLQPSLKLLKEKLTDAQTESSKLRGVLTETHPKVVAAALTEKQILHQLQDEVKSALRGIEADLTTNANQIRTMQGQFADVQNRLDRLANLRARYGNLVADMRQRSQSLAEITQKLAEARATRNASASSSQLTRFGEPIVGDRPVGPSKKIVVMGSTASGLTLGAGLVFLFMPIGPNGSHRRWSDYLKAGRRATDNLLGRRASDLTGAVRGPANQSLPTGSTRRSEDRKAPPPSLPGGRRSADSAPAAVRVVPPAAEPEPTYPEIDRRLGIDRRIADPK